MPLQLLWTVSNAAFTLFLQWLFIVSLQSQSTSKNKANTHTHISTYFIHWWAIGSRWWFIMLFTVFCHSCWQVISYRSVWQRIKQHPTYWFPFPASYQWAQEGSLLKTAIAVPKMFIFSILHFMSRQQNVWDCNERPSTVVQESWCSNLCWIYC